MTKRRKESDMDFELKTQITTTALARLKAKVKDAIIMDAAGDKLVVHVPSSSTYALMSWAGEDTETPGAIRRFIYDHAAD